MGKSEHVFAAMFRGAARLSPIESINVQRAQLALDREKQPTTNDITNRLAHAGGAQ